MWPKLLLGVVFQAFTKGPYSVHAGEYHPIELIEARDGLVERSEGERRGYLNCGDEDGGGSQRLQEKGKFGRLLAGTGNQNATTCER